MKMDIHIEEWELNQPFRISGFEWLSIRAVVVKLHEDGCIGRGEAEGVYYLNETADSIFAQLHEFAGEIEKGISRDRLPELLPAGGARNAIDCALWDLECKQTGKTIWELTGISPTPVTTVFTIGLESTPEAMAAKAAAAADAPILKIKLDGKQPYEKLAAIRQVRPDAVLVVDANQGWDFRQLQKMVTGCMDLELEMIEQPLPRGGDEALESYDSPILLAGDESCLHVGELETALMRYGMINIKLDKTGGLTGALEMARAARAKGCKLMVGNMGGTSLAMAPAFAVAQLCDFVDIDGPLNLKYDHVDGLRYKNGIVNVFESGFWGSPI